MSTMELLSTLEMGLIFGLVALGVTLTYRVMDTPDLTVDGSFPLGAAICAKLLLMGYTPLGSMCIATMGGMVAGGCTGWILTKLKMNALICGIITMIALYSINLRIMGTSNISIYEAKTIFDSAPALVIIACTVVVIYFLLCAFLSTEIGLALRASGLNISASRIQGINTNHMRMLAFIISNGLVALAGALNAQLLRFADISMGTGTIIAGISALILGEWLMKRHLSLLLLGCIFGAVIYRLFITGALHITGAILQASDINLIMAVCILVFMSVSKKANKMQG